MPSTDTIADMLTCIRNANSRELEKVDVPSSKIKEEVVKILKKEGYVANYKLIDDRKQGILRVYLKYGPNREKIIRGIKRVSKPSKRVYSKWDAIPKNSEGFGVFILSTSKGVMTNKRCKENKLGGEIICEVW